jgi:glutathione S-transferase
VIRLYRAHWSTNCERVALALAHKGVEVESVLISYSDRSPVERISGQGLVPVIVDGDEVIHDSTRIIRRLEQRFPEAPLWPADPARGAELDLFLEWFNEEWKRAKDTELFHVMLDDHLRLGDDHPQLAAWIDRVDALPRAYGPTIEE